jgi:hypothetical protein
MTPTEALQAYRAEAEKLLAEWLAKRLGFQKGLAGAEPLYREVKAQLLGLKEAPVVSISEYGVALAFYRLLSKRRRELQKGFAVCEMHIKTIQTAIDKNQAALQVLQDAVECNPSGPNNILEFPHGSRRLTD